MQHALTVFLASETPVRWAALIVGFLIWLSLGVSMWRGLSWLRRILYVAGGVVLSYYELHMDWYWFAAGLVLLLLALIEDLLRPRLPVHDPRRNMKDAGQ